MMALTHALFSTFGAALVLGTADPGALLTAAIASQFPDIDITSSYIGKIFYPISKFLEERFPHRTITHSFLGTAIVSGIAAPLFFWNRSYYAALVVGFAFGWFGDCFTKSGVAAFYPSPARLVIPGNPQLRFKSGSPPERIVFFVIAIALAGMLYLNAGGGIIAGVTQAIGQTEGARDFYLQNRNSNIVIATVDGQHLITGNPIKGNFEVVGIDGNELLLQSSNGLLKTGQEVRVSRITTSKGSPVKVETRELTLAEESPADALAKLGSIPIRTYISGNLNLEDAEDLVIPSSAETFTPISGSGGNITLNNAAPQNVAKLLGEYDASGNLIVRSIYVQQQSPSSPNPTQ